MKKRTKEKRGRRVRENTKKELKFNGCSLLIVTLYNNS